MLLDLFMPWTFWEQTFLVSRSGEIKRPLWPGFWWFWRLVCACLPVSWLLHYRWCQHLACWGLEGGVIIVVACGGVTIMVRFGWGDYPLVLCALQHGGVCTCSLYVCQHQMHDSRLTEHCVKHGAWMAMAEWGVTIHGKPHLSAPLVSMTPERQVVLTREFCGLWYL